ncbi:hypothetical protein [Comamonas badia]|uniref:hypothetical protein n=1 Tax=Comamonas badia TaxID=265291 RepID=UPI0012EBB51E|nr:hypothetical protein [Comamonas badia]
MNQQIRQFLLNLGPEPISDVVQLQRLLAEVWSSLSGASDGGMKGDKLLDRAESMSWDPPYITFSIERHGSVVNGSTRAEIQDWCVDLDKWTAEIISTRCRQLYPTSRPMPVNTPAEEIAHAILNKLEHESLNWYGDDRVRVLIGTIIPDGGYKQTVSGRRGRFRKALGILIEADDWKAVAANTYQRSSAQR